MIGGERRRLRAAEREDLPCFGSWLIDPEALAHLSLFMPPSLGEEKTGSRTHGEATNEKAVFVHDGRMRQAEYRNGSIQYIPPMSVLRSEYQDY